MPGVLERALAHAVASQVRFGDWSWMLAPDGLALQVIEASRFDAELSMVLEQLEAAGIEGMLDVEQEIWRPDPKLAVLACRVRVKGHRVPGPHHSPNPRPLGPAFGWEAETEAHESMLRLGAKWCASRCVDGQFWVASSLDEAAVAVGSVDEAIRVASSHDGLGMPVIWTGDASDFRMMVIGARFGEGQLSLSASPGDDWEGELGGLQELLVTHAPWITYAYVVRDVVHGTNAPQLQLGTTQWPYRENFVPHGTWYTAGAFEDQFVPDAFGLQLLGPTFNGRIPSGHDWVATRLGDATLLAHRDPAAWFAAPLLGDVEYFAWAPPPPPLLAKAREDFAELLYTPGALARAGILAPDDGR